MPEPVVLAVCLTADRHEMTARAVRSFLAQIYGNKKLFVLDTGTMQFPLKQEHRVYGEYHPTLQRKSIGALRNVGNSFASPKCLDAEIILHWDSDDYSHPNRIAEQVTLLQASGKQCVGYRDMLFWREGFPEKCPQCGGMVLKLSNGSWTCRTGGCELEGRPGEAWLYHNDDPRYCLGTSLCYWRETWEKRPFKDISRGEDKEFLRDRDTLGIEAVTPFNASVFEPRIIALIHSGNHVVYEPEKSLPPPAGNWKRVPEWDNYCRERMTL